MSQISQIGKTLSLAGFGIVGALAGCGTDAKACDPDAPGTICTVAGNGSAGYGGDNGPALDAIMWWPQDTVIVNGELWIEDFNNYLVRAVDSTGKIRTVIGTGELGDSPDPGMPNCPALAASFNHTTSLTVYNNWLYMAAWHGSRVKRVDLSTMLLENFAGKGLRTFYYGDDGPALDAAVDLPTAIAIDPAGNVTIMDQANQVIRQVDQAGNIHHIAGKCVIDQFQQCTDDELTLCPNSDKWVCGNPDEYCGMNGSLYGTADCNPAFGGDGGPASELRMAQEYGQMARPSGRLAYDSAGNLFFADSHNNRIRKISAADNTVSTVVGNGIADYSGDGGPATSAAINFPVDLQVAPDGTIYFADFFNSCIRKVDPSGTISTVAGMCSSNPDDVGFSGDGGPPTKAKLNDPSGIDLVGNKLYISDTYNNRVRVVNL